MEESLLHPWLWWGGVGRNFRHRPSRKSVRSHTFMTRLELAELMLVDAQWNLAGERYRSAVSQAYYACHHTGNAYGLITGRRRKLPEGYWKLWTGQNPGNSCSP